MADLEKVIRGLEVCKTAPELKEECAGCPYDDGQDDCIARMAADALELLSDPDRVRVVRCSDCRFWEPENAEEGDSYGRCRNDYAPCQNQQTDMNWFCADGEREE